MQHQHETLMRNCISKTKREEISPIFKLESDEARHWGRNELDTVGAVKSGDDSLPQIFLAVLGPTDRLQHVIELSHTPGNHIECIACTADNAHKVLVVCWCNVMQTGLCTHAKPEDQINNLSVFVYWFTLRTRCLHNHKYSKAWCDVAHCWFVGVADTLWQNGSTDQQISATLCWSAPVSHSGVSQPMT